MRTTSLRTLLLLLCTTSLVACATGSDDSPDPEGNLERECRDEIDNDDDGLVDCADDGCAGVGICGITGGDVAQPDAGSDAESDAVDPDAGTDAADPDVGDPDAVDPDADAVDSDDVDPDTTEPDAIDPDVATDTTPDVGPADPTIRSCSTTFTRSAPGASRVQVAGEFTNWLEGAVDMTQVGGMWQANIEIDAGEYAFKYVVDGVFEYDGFNELPRPIDFYTHWDGNNENRNAIVGDCGVPALRTFAASSDRDSVSATFLFERAADGAPLDTATLTVRVGDQVVTPVYDDESSTIVVDVDGLEYGKHSIWVEAQDTEGRSIELSPHFVPLWVEETPYEWRDATMYFVFTDRFRDGDIDEGGVADPIPGVPEIANYQGGDFLGVIQAIEEGYFANLGVDLLWLSPIQENPEGVFIAADRVNNFSGFHGYWPTHARQIEFRWGDVFEDSDTRFRELVDVAHENGIRILLDIPLNHVHDTHHYTTEHPEWFIADVCNCTTDAGECNWDTNPLFCWFIDYLPDLDFRIHEIVEQVGADVEWLVTEYDIDAFRIDAAKHMNHVIMNRVALRLEERFEDGGGMPIYLVGETFVGDSGHGLIMEYVSDSELDAQYDFPLLYPIRDVFAFSSQGVDYLSDRRRISEEQYGEAYWLMSPFLGNHDIPRFATYLHGDLPDPWSGAADPMRGELNDANWNVINRMSAGFAFVLTQPGIPLIYYGDEIGLYGGADPDNRRMMSFNESLSEPQRTLLERVQQIGQARRDHESLRRGEFRELWVDRDGGGIMLYARDNGDGDVALVAFNVGNGGTRQVPIPADLTIDGTRFVDALGSSRTASVTSANLTLTLAQWEYVIYVPE